MKKISIIISSCLLSILAFGQDMERVNKTIETLCSPEYHGRGYDFGGDSIAAAYITKEFKAAGLKSFEKESYYQYFDFNINTFTGKMKFKAGKNYKPGTDFIVAATSPTCRIKNAKLHYVDDATFSDEEKLSASLQSVDINSILVLTSTQYKKLNGKNVKIQKLAYRNFKAFVIITGKLTMTHSQKQYGIPI